MDIKELKGVGDKTALLFSRLNVYTTQDLVGLYPRDYDVYEEPALIDAINSDYEKMTVAVDGVVAKRVDVFNTGKLTCISTVVRDADGKGIRCVWYNMPFLKSTLRQGMRYVFRGRVSVKNGQLSLEQPAMYTLAQYNSIKGSMQPIYPLTKGLSNKLVIKSVKQALEVYNTGLEQEYITDAIREKYNLAEHNYAVVNIHFPKNCEDYVQARKRLSFEEFFLFILAIRTLKNSTERISNSHHIGNDERTDDFISKLPYSLTNAQKNTWNEIKDNMSGDKLMSRLVQGDVGSGKTIIAVLALMNTVYAGYQGALMAPTEVLARQHYESMNAMFERYGVDIKVVLLVGSQTSAQRKKVYAMMESGEAGIVVGTHALIQEKAVYHNLGLVITDEQHRFGVNQRRTLQDKGENPHILVMSATPIPRTLGIIIYGDLDISVIDELPADRLPIKNCVVDESYRPNAYTFISKQVQEGRQAYVICPMVEAGDEDSDLENVVDYSKKLKASLPAGICVEYLHGKMKPQEKNDIMERFLAGGIHVLVSTTVVEVGVNVPNASVMMIENAERFGLAQLHQLRGRVGRGKHQSYCIFVTGNKSKETKERLGILEKTNDGFKIAEEDLRLRGPGDFLGVRQSGEMDFGIADIYADSRMLKAASDSAQSILDEDPLLESKENRLLSKKVSEYTLKCLCRINL